MSADAIEQAKRLLHAGKAQEAWASLQAIDEADAAAGQLWYYRSLAALNSGHLEDAEASASQALARDPGQPYFHLQAARVYEALEAPEGAIVRYQHALALQPTLALAWLGLGRCLALSGRNAEARAALEASAANGAAPAASLELARLDYAEGRLVEALTQARQAISSTELKSDALLLLGDIHQRRQEYAEALRHYQAADQTRPDDPRASLAMAVLLREQGRWQGAIRAYADLATRNPACLAAALGAALSLPSLYGGAAELEQARKDFERGLAQLGARQPEMFVTTAPQLMQELRWSNFLLAYQGRDDCALQSMYGDFVNGLLVHSAPDWLRLPTRAARRPGKVRIGFVSHFFYDCTAGRYFSPWVTGLDPRRFDVYVYYTNTRYSPNTERIRQAATGFRHMPLASVHAMARRVREDALDILVYPEVGMYPDTQVLASLRLAPVQCVAWGHPTTTGLPTLDWFISCAAMEPADAQRHYRERLALLPGLGTCYAHPEPPRVATRRVLGLPEGKTLYLIPQSAFKIHPDNDELIASVLAADRNGIGVLFEGDARPIVDALVQRLTPTFERRGLSTRTDLLFLPAMPHDAYLAVNQHCDVMLDTLHWSGGNTALDALSVGLPLVTLPGGLMRGRQSSAMLRALGLESLVARDTADYIRLAARLGTDAVWRAQCRAAILASKSRLFDDPEPIQALNNLLLSLASPQRARVESSPTQ